MVSLCVVHPFSHTLKLPTMQFEEITEPAIENEIAEETVIVDAEASHEPEEEEEDEQAEESKEDESEEEA